MLMMARLWAVLSLLPRERFLKEEREASIMIDLYEVNIIL